LLGHLGTISQRLARQDTLLYLFDAADVIMCVFSCIQHTMTLDGV